MKIVILGMGLLAHFALAFDDTYERSDSGIFGPKYATILADMHRIASENPGLVEMFDYGTSVKGQPLRMLVVSRPGVFPNRPALVMTGSTHGNEYLNIEDRLPERLLQKNAASDGVQRFLSAGGVLILVPILNPDGYDRRRRENANGVDLNRDWDVKPAGYTGFRQVETRALAMALQKFHQERGYRYEVTVDYHCCIGALLHPWSYKNVKLPAGDQARHHEVSSPAEKLLNIDVGTTSDVLGYAPLGTTKDYYYITYGARAFTYEGRYGSEKQYLDQHVTWWDQVAGMVADSFGRPIFSLKTERKQFLMKLAD